MEKKFIQYDYILNEFNSFESVIDYEKIFNEIDDETKFDLELLTSYYYTDINYQEYSNILPCIKNIGKLPINIKIYYLKDDNIFPTQNASYCKLGLSLYLSLRDTSNLNESTGVLQNVSFTIKNDLNEDEFKNYIYNLLFYAHIIIKYFVFHPMLKYLYHSDDIENLVELKNVHVRLFGEKNECPICMEETIGKTICKHSLCQQCYIGLQTKKCPICRKILYNENEVYETITRFIIN